MKTLFTTTALALVVSGGLALTPAAAQQNQNTQQQTQTGQQQGQGQQAQGQGQQGQQAQGQGQQAQGEQGQDQQQGQQAQGQQQGQQAQGQQAQGQQAQGQQAQDQALIVVVGDREFRGADVAEAIGELPPQLRQQPMEMLIPMAIDQLVTRELILQRAIEAGLEEDPEVVALVEPETQDARERAMIQVWLQRELDARAGTDRARQVYDEAVAATPGQEAPPFEQVRPLIEQQLRQQALQGIRADLQEGADITFYGPTGQPLPQGQQPGQNQTSQ